MPCAIEDREYNTIECITDTMGFNLKEDSTATAVYYNGSVAVLNTDTVTLDKIEKKYG